MTIEIHEILRSRFGDDNVFFHDGTQDPYISVNPEQIQIICMYLRYNPELKFSFFQNLSGVDYPETNLMTVVYHIFSMKLNMTCVLKISVSRDFPEIDSIESVWKTAGWFEREAFDLLGIKFLNHSKLERLLLPADWEGHPLRKDYQEGDFYHDMETTRQNKLRMGRQNE
jgi:NADH-quinone oxidoreductase subunit C